jgi:hypothetical protein
VTKGRVSPCDSNALGQKRNSTSTVRANPFGRARLERQQAQMGRTQMVFLGYIFKITRGTQ